MAETILSAAAGGPEAGPVRKADPYGLWQLAAGDGVSFDAPGSGGAVAPEAMAPAAHSPEADTAVWTLSLTSGAGGQASGMGELERRAGQIQAINAGLDEARARSEALLGASALQGGGAQKLEAAANGVSFAAGSPVEQLPAPEADLVMALNALAAAKTGGPASYGLSDDISRLAGVNWGELCQRFVGLMDSVNRQLMHFAWVDTRLDGRLVARTTVNWRGDITTLWQPGLSPEPCSAHRRSLNLAMASRSANLRTVLTVAQIAGKMALAAGNPLVALSLGWQFVREVMMPLLEQAGG